jgi:hypothetical protein
MAARAIFPAKARLFPDSGAALLPIPAKMARRDESRLDI